MSFPKLERRLRGLRNWEALNVALLPCLVVWVWSRGGDLVAWPARLPALALVSLILAQGALYWHLKLESVRRGMPLPRSFRRLFRGLRTSALVGFVVAGASAAAVYLAGWSRGVDIVWAGALLGFATLEYVNYYHWQLKHDSAADWAYLRRHRRLRRAPLAVDLARVAHGTPQR